MEKEKINYKENEKNVRIPLIHACLILVLISLFNELTITGTLLLFSLVLLEYLFADDFFKKMRLLLNVSNQLNFLHVSSNISINETDIRVNKTGVSQTIINSPILNQEHVKKANAEKTGSGKNEPAFSPEQNNDVENQAYPDLQRKWKKTNRIPGDLKVDLQKTMEPEDAKKTFLILKDMYDNVDKDDYIVHVFCFMKALQEKYNGQFPTEKNTFPTSCAAFGRAAANNYKKAGNIQKQLNNLMHESPEKYWKIIEQYKEKIPRFSRPYPKK